MRLFMFSLLLSLVSAVMAMTPQLQDQVSAFYGNGTATGRHTNNWAVLVCSSRYWFNYRHMANTLAMYRTIKRLGIPDSNILLMLADDVACNARNPFPATVYANSGRQMDLYGEGIEVDYRGYEVTVESFLRLLTGRQPAHTPPSKRLLTDASSNVFIYLTGHGGNEFLKFQDNEEVSAYDVADAVEQMREKRRFNKLLYVIDTCQANTMYSKFYSPEVISTGSSAIGENSYSHHNDMDIGVAVIDSFTHYILQYLESLTKTSKETMRDFFAMYDPTKIHSHPGVDTSLSTVGPESILVTDFFGGVVEVESMPAEREIDLLKVAGRGWQVGAWGSDEVQAPAVGDAAKAAWTRSLVTRGRRPGASASDQGSVSLAGGNSEPLKGVIVLGGVLLAVMAAVLRTIQPTENIRLTEKLKTL